MRTRKAITVSMDEETLNLIDAELRRRNAIAQRDGTPQWTRSSLMRRLCIEGINRTRSDDLKRMCRTPADER